MTEPTNPFQVGAAVLVTFCDRRVTEREVGKVWNDGAFQLFGAPRKQRWIPENACGHWRAYPAPPAIDPAAFIVMAAKPKGKA